MSAPTVERTFLVYASANPAPGSITYPDNQTIWIRVEEYRGGTDVMDYGARHERPGETFVNSVTLEMKP